MKRIAVVTVARSDFGIYLPLLRRIDADPTLHLQLIAGGAHFCPDHGTTANEIVKQGFSIAARVDMTLASDEPVAISKSMALGMLGFASAYEQLRPDVLVVLGDRFEMHAAVAAAVPFALLIAHIHGGEVTEGAIDDVLRHSITKLSHWHFVATEEYGRRVCQMGEDPSRVVVSGAPSLDNLNDIELMDEKTLKQRVGLDWQQPPLLVTFHPVTREPGQAERQALELVAALQQQPRPMVITRPNADTENAWILRILQGFADGRPDVQLVDNLGTQAYFSMMKHAAAMVGNSSSGLIEAPSFGLPVVNIGIRQAGRVRGQNVIDVADDRAAIAAGLGQALDPAFRKAIADSSNPYGDGQAAQQIVRHLKDASTGPEALRKRFFNVDMHDVCLNLNKRNVA